MLAFIEVDDGNLLVVDLAATSIEKMQELEANYNFKRIIYKDKEVC